MKISKNIENLFRYLVDGLWPGPLTIVMKYNEEKLPKILTANTGYVGIRMPDNEVKN